MSVSFDSSLRYFQNVPLAPLTGFRVGGKAKYLVKVFDADGLKRARQLSLNTLIIGKGSKLLINDDGFDGTAIVMRINTLKFFEDKVFAGAGVFLPSLSLEFASRGLTGLEWACAIPASIGGAVVMNAGAHGFEMKDIVDYIEVLRGESVIKLENPDCGFGYRKSALKGDIVLGAMLKAEKGCIDAIKQNRSDNLKKRALTQPAGYSCGSVFKSGEMPAWKYIDACGLRGARVGDACISVKHTNFIINNGKATAKDINALIDACKAETYLKFKIKLTEEVIKI